MSGLSYPRTLRGLLDVLKMTCSTINRDGTSAATRTAGLSGFRSARHWGQLAFTCVFVGIVSCCALATDARVSDRIDALSTSYKLDSASLGISVCDLETGETIYDRNSSKALIPASNMKLLVTAAALKTLGPDFQFRTTLYTKGSIQDKTLSGDLIVKGGGDPNISGRFHDGDPVAVFADWAAKLKALGVTRVTGGILLDDTIFDRQFVVESWPQERTNWYCAEVAGLSLNDNCVDITVMPGDKPGAPARISVSPETSYVTIVNKCSTTPEKARHLISFTRPNGANVITVSGRVWTKSTGFKDSVTIHDPPMFFGVVLKQVLAKNGIEVCGETRMSEFATDEKAFDMKETASFTSGLPETIAVANKRSQNFYAECLLKMIGWKRFGKGTGDNGLRALAEFLERAGVSADSCTAADGSGLSRENRVSAADFTKVISYMRKQPEWKPYRDSFAVCGTDGTLEKRLTTEPLKGRVLGKTGSISRVSALSGVIETDNGTFAFSILTNDYNTGQGRVKDFEDDVCRAIFAMCGKK
jgi:D-alanyl-D-alanine carboxypeptidase/D-alanyl-D-alanine-endopeptidase (penicillin-binding protein 4)